MDLFESKNIKPMLIGKSQGAFDSPDYIFELKFDGERCIAYLDKDLGTELRNKRNLKMLSKVPELSKIHKQVKITCILDGELLIFKKGKPDFYEIQKRSLMSNAFKIQLASSKHPASFTAFDILYYKDHQVTDLSLMERKKLLGKTIEANERILISPYIEEKGMELYKLSEKEDLEGIVAKQKDSKYFFGKRTKDWIKIKNLMDDDFVVCGYIVKDKGIISIVLGQYKNDHMIYKGHVTLGVSTIDFKLIKGAPKISTPYYFINLPKGNEKAIWVEPILVGTVEYMMKTSSGSLRQPVFKGLRKDKKPEECTVTIDKN